MVDMLLNMGVDQIDRMQEPEGADPALHIELETKSPDHPHRAGFRMCVWRWIGSLTPYFVPQPRTLLNTPGDGVHDFWIIYTGNATGKVEWGHLNLGRLL